MRQSRRQARKARGGTQRPKKDRKKEKTKKKKKKIIIIIINAQNQYVRTAVIMRGFGLKGQVKL